jgi:hypothetical protein
MTQSSPVRQIKPKNESTPPAMPTTKLEMPSLPAMTHHLGNTVAQNTQSTE